MDTTVLDESALKQFIEDIGPAADELVNFFIIDIRGKLDELAGLASDTDLPALAIHAHSLKGLSRTCGLLAISETAYELEKACREDDRERALIQFDVISKAIDPTIDALKAFVEKHPPTQEP